ncbi:mucin-binding protein [Secundilactobacillus folii]|uniref:Gram-positive cocci surface proteins LPxTG domain-containing protein n=1 Tax=Secundilactobacillus folii TaxID=2678357 RepID=A0A7X3C1X2_9LACO|nr:KxYKxGKxW signal peptide domain-containing protein [Secundilactobacillus folii]MTV81222.1 hypothetical protein [Secundilactobacillus folii]
MVGKNNRIRLVKANSREHYKAYKAGTRWLYASLASLALSAGLLFSLNPTAVHADAQGSSDHAQSVNVQTKVPSATDSTSKQTVLHTSPSAANDVPASVAARSASTSNSTASATSAASSLVESQSQSALPASNSAVNEPQSSTADQSSNHPSVQSSTAASSESQTGDSKTLVDPTQAQLNEAKASAKQVYEATRQAQQITAAASDPVTESTGTLSLSATKVGYKTGEGNQLTLTLQANAKAGDVYAITLPADSGVYQFSSVNPLDASAGTTTVTHNVDKSETVTDTFAADTTTTQLISFNLNNNYVYVDDGMNDVGKTVTKTVGFSINGVKQPGVTFTQTIQPTTNLSSVSMVYPDATKVTKILPDQDYVFSLNVNETDGVQDDSYPVSRVHSGDNYGGTTITIPVPTGFVLNAASTKQINAFGDATTITQPGGKGTNVVINVPAKSGAQYESSNAQAGYKLIGDFDVAQTNEDQTLTANGNTTFSQVINSDGDTLTDSASPWSVIIQATGQPSQVSATPTIKGNSGADASKLVLDNNTDDDPAYIDSFGFALNDASPVDHFQIQVTIPDGLDATEIKVPVQDVSPSGYLPDTSSWAYTLTLADGSTETGTVNAGGTATPTADSPIRSAVFVPNKIAVGTYANNLGTADSFEVLGHLSNTYDNGTKAVVNGDQLTSTASVSLDANGGTPTADSSVIQQVTEGLALASNYTVVRSSDPGNSNAGTLEVRYLDSIGQNTNDVYEPTFYFVIPKTTTVASINSLPWYTDVPGSTTGIPITPDGSQLTETTHAKVSEFTADDGQTVVKIDYSGTGETVDFSQKTGYWGAVTLANDPDALPGKYPYAVYIVSPTTKLKNTTQPSDLSFVEGHTDAYLMDSEVDDPAWLWTIATASSFFTTSMAKGNQGTQASKSGASGNHGSPDMTFYDSIVYTAVDDNAADSNASVAINLPTIGDSKGSTFTIDLTGPIEMPTHYTLANSTGDPIKATVLYSTSPQVFSATDTAPNTTGYVTADQVSDWSAIRSIIIQISGIKANSSTGRIAINGQVANQTVGDQTITIEKMVGDTGTLQTAFYGNGGKVNISSDDASINIVGTAIIPARYHYVDATGTDKYVDLTDLQQTLKDGDTFTNNYPTQLSDFSAADQKLLPAGYELVTDSTGKVTPTIVDSTGDGAAAFGQPVDNTFDGDFVQYELVAQQSAKIEYVDDDNNGAIVDSKTVNGDTGQAIGWNTDGMTLPAGYQLADGATASGTYTFTAESNQVVPVHVIHAVKDSQQTTTRTIHYVVNDPSFTGKVPADKVQTTTWNITTDEVTGESIATPVNGYFAVTSPTLAGYTPDPDTVALEAYKPGTTSAMPKNETVTVTYSLAPQSVTVEYVDDANNGNVLKTTATITGKTNGTAYWNTNNLPAGYVLAKGQADNGTYTFTANANQVIPVHVVHAVKNSQQFTTRTIHYVVQGATNTGLAPADKVQTTTWNITTDEVTGESIATPVNGYYAVTSPTVAGYRPDPSSVGKKTYQPGLASAIPQNEQVTVTYTANKLTVSVTYVNTKTGQPISTIQLTGNTGTAIVVPNLPGYILDRTGDPTSFEPDLTHFNVPATPVNPGNPSNTGTQGNPGNPGNSGNSTVPTKPKGPQTITGQGNSGKKTKPNSPKTPTVPGKSSRPVKAKKPTTSGSSQSSDVTFGLRKGQMNAEANGSFGRDSANGSVADESAFAKNRAVTLESQNAVSGHANSDSTVEQNRLPQTGEQDYEAGGLSLLGLITGLFSWLGFRQRKRHED